MTKRGALVFALLGLAMPGALAHGSHGTVVEEISRISDAVPDLDLVDQSGQILRIAAVLKDPARTIVVTFTYTRCKTLCPVVVPMAMDVVRQLQADRMPARLVVFTVDPANDRAAEMSEHAAALGASSDDLFVTGDASAMRRMLRYFGVTSADPEQHPPLILARRAGREGFTRMIVGDRTTTARLGAIIRGEGN